MIPVRDGAPVLVLAICNEDEADSGILSTRVARSNVDFISFLRLGLADEFDANLISACRQVCRNLNQHKSSTC